MSNPGIPGTTDPYRVGAGTPPLVFQRLTFSIGVDNNSCNRSCNDTKDDDSTQNPYDGEYATCYCSRSFISITYGRHRDKRPPHTCMMEIMIQLYDGDNDTTVIYCGDKRPPHTCMMEIIIHLYDGDNHTTAIHCGDNHSTAIYGGDNPTSAIHCGDNPTSAIHCGDDFSPAIYFGDN